LLVFKLAVDGDEYIEGVLSEAQQRTVLTASPADFGDCLNVNAWKCRPHPGIDTFI